jgi:uncharacterized protein YraI
MREDARNSMWKQILAASGGALMATTAAMADATAVSTGNLNIRGGPGTNYQVLGVIALGSPVSVQGCVTGTNWCFVNFGGMQGWSNNRWLATQTGMPAAYAAADLRIVSPGVGTTTYASTAPTYTRTYSSYYGSNYYGPNYYGGRIGDGRGLFGRPRLIGSAYRY